MTGRADGWIRWTTTGCVALLALIAGTVSYLHMHRLVALYGQPGWVASLTPLSVDGMSVAASATLLAESRAGRRGAVLLWALPVPTQGDATLGRRGRSRPASLHEYSAGAGHCVGSGTGLDRLLMACVQAVATAPQADRFAGEGRE